MRYNLEGKTGLIVSEMRLGTNHDLRHQPWPLRRSGRWVAKSHNATMAAVALAWLLHQRSVTSVILGVKRVQQLEENLAATDLRLTVEDLEVLGQASEPSSEYPGWMFQYSGGPRQALLDTQFWPSMEARG